uniref:Uncharacterized protein n=1 Tax=Rhizophora mucronata TaxID=61149 RepID=A0A2P2NP04_RHIMU
MLLISFYVPDKAKTSAAPESSMAVTIFPKSVMLTWCSYNEIPDAPKEKYALT